MLPCDWLSATHQRGERRPKVRRQNGAQQSLRRGDGAERVRAARRLGLTGTASEGRGAHCTAPGPAAAARKCRRRGDRTHEVSVGGRRVVQSRRGFGVGGARRAQEGAALSGRLGGRTHGFLGNDAVLSLPCRRCRWVLDPDDCRVEGRDSFNLMKREAAARRVDRVPLFLKGIDAAKTTRIRLACQNCSADARSTSHMCDVHTGPNSCLAIACYHIASDTGRGHRMKAHIHHLLV
jgi:hypothetical protein